MARGPCPVALASHCIMKALHHRATALEQFIQRPAEFVAGHCLYIEHKPTCSKVLVKLARLEFVSNSNTWRSGNHCEYRRVKPCRDHNLKLAQGADQFGG